MTKEQKTNVMRILEKERIPYQAHFYEHDDDMVDGVSVAEKLDQDVNAVFKTLVTKGCGREYYVFVIPVAKELNLKAAAKCVGEKAVELIPVADLQKVTGYIRGGCSPIGMKKAYPTVLDASCLELETMMFSGGKIGAQVELEPRRLLQLIDAKTGELTMN